MMARVFLASMAAGLLGLLLAAGDWGVVNRGPAVYPPDGGYIGSVHIEFLAEPDTVQLAPRADGGWWLITCTKRGDAEWGDGDHPAGILVRCKP